MTAPRISVIVVAYDRAEFVGEALGSVARQNRLSSDYETVLLAHRDGRSVGRLLDPPGVRRLELESGTWGEWVAAALSECRGEVLAFLDDDDLYEPGKIAAVLHAFASRPSLVYYHHRVERFEADGVPRDVVGPTLGLLTDAGKTRSISDRLFWDLGGFNLSSIAVRRSLVESNVDLLRDLRVGHSLAMFYAALIGPGDLYFDPAVLGRYRIHAQNQSVPAGTSLGREWARVRTSVPPVIRDADRIAAFIDARRDPRVSSGPVRSVRSRNRLLQLLVERGTSRSALLRGQIEFVRRTPPRIAYDHRGLLGLSALGLIDPGLPDRWIARQGHSPDRA